MKLRHRVTGIEVNMDGWEPVPGPEPGPLPAPEHWRDVTEECTIEHDDHKGWQIRHNGSDVLWAAGYRVRKSRGGWFVGMAICNVTQGQSIIIEKLVP
ncbi:MAG TPA: hypothetical protein VIR02_00535 [Anaerolineales bacterium]